MLNQQMLRKKLISTHKVKHITEAIELVASIKLQKLLKNMEHFRLYATKMTEIVENLAQVIEGQFHPFFEVRASKNIGIIILTSDKGLCGSYNANLLKQADHFLDQHSKNRIKLILFGQKSVDHYSKQDYEIQNEYTSYGSQINETNIKKWCGDFIRSFENKQLDEVWIVYTHYKSILVRETKVEKILPMHSEKSNAIDHKKNIKSDYIFEPNANEIYNKIISHTLYTKFRSLLLESQASELAARVVSMKAATTNAEEMISKLTLVKNKIRQMGITKEILEINAGAEGLL